MGSIEMKIDSKVFNKKRKIIIIGESGFVPVRFMLIKIAPSLMNHVSWKNKNLKKNFKKDKFLEDIFL